MAMKKVVFYFPTITPYFCGVTFDNALGGANPLKTLRM